MKKGVLILIAVLLIGGLFLASRHHAGKSGAPSVANHSMAPDFTLTDLNGQPLSLASYRGKVVLLDFWATWCTPCRAEIPHFIEFQNNYRDQGLQVVGISMDDDLKPVRPFYQEFKMNYPVALSDDKIADAYGGILGLPVNFIIDRDGKIKAKHTGFTELPTIENEIETALATPPQAQ